jgi:leucyl/phenylalanyl-tRNA--protein transferase
VIPWLGASDPFPPLTRALVHPNGLLAAGADLAPARLVEAYRHGIFPWFSEGEPILWWSPDPRMVLIPNQVKVTRSLAKTLRRRDFEIRVDTSFAEVMRECAAPRDGQDGTWISPAMVHAYSELHRMGLAHSVETWREGALIGGLYGVALGRAFYGESMFSRAPDASKIALVALCRQLERWGFGLIDCQMHTAHLESMGASPLSRAAFARRLAELTERPALPGPWRFDTDSRMA